VKELLSYLFPNPQTDGAALIADATDFFDTVIGENLDRCPDAQPLIFKLSGTVSFVTTFEGAPKAAGMA
jgi:hypothetical protein